MGFMHEIWKIVNNSLNNAFQFAYNNIYEQLKINPHYMVTWYMENVKQVLTLFVDFYYLPEVLFEQAYCIYVNVEQIKIYIIAHTNFFERYYVQILQSSS